MYSSDNYQDTMNFYFFTKEGGRIEDYYKLETSLISGETQIISFEFQEFEITVMLYPIDLNSNSVRFYILDIEEI